MTEQRPKLIRAAAKAVLGEYDHEISFPEDQDFMIVYGPNGVGKTRFLEILHGLSRVNGRTLSRMPFSHAELEYSDGTRIEASKAATVHDVDENPNDDTIIFVLHQVGRRGKPPRWQYTGDAFEDWLIDNTPYRPYDDESMWEDPSDGEIVHISSLMNRYPYPRKYRKDRNGSPRPQPFTDFINEKRSYLIETQRLRIELLQPPPRASSWRHVENAPRARHSSRISEHAAQMRKLVSGAQTQHSTITQQLDRTFPSRILDPSAPFEDAESKLDAGAVRGRYERQNEFRSRLGRVASVELADELSLPDRPLRMWELRLLDQYLDDADLKLAPFELLLQKIELLEEIVNSRLMNKRLQVTANQGLSVIHKQDGRSIDLDALSSGEQHEIILMFDLLFNVPEGALVLIDEPEISLHVIWQLAFIPDVQRIAELAGFRFVVATHSPQIINDAWDRAVRLGPEEIQFT